MALNEDAFYELDFEQAPCEFCSELFPFELLIEHQSGCRPDLVHFAIEDLDDDFLPIPVVPQRAPVIEPSLSTKIAQLNIAVEPTKEKEELQKTPPKNNLKTPNPEKKDNVGQKKSPIKKGKENASSFEDLITFDGTAIPFEDVVEQESATKIMSYGSSMTKRVEEEKPSFRSPPLPLLNNADQREGEDFCNNLSDDDAGEYLEDFWRRAEIRNAQRQRSRKS